MVRTIRLFVLLLLFMVNRGIAQPEVAAWGNVNGIRVDGQLMFFETKLSVVGNDWSSIWQTGKERQWSQYSRRGNTQFSEIRMDSLFFEVSVTDRGMGVAEVQVDFECGYDSSDAQVYYSILLDGDDYQDGYMKVIGQQNVPLKPQEGPEDVILRSEAAGLRVVSSKRDLEVLTDHPAPVFVRSDSAGSFFEVYFGLVTNPMVKGQTTSRTFTITAGGEIDKEPVEIVLNTSVQSERKFEGIGGNFRLQNPTLDPQVIDYSLENLRVAQARLELPWRQWHPDENLDPMTAELHPHVKQSMELAKKIYDRGIPVILADWSAPDWAVVGTYSSRPVNGVWGNVLDSTKSEKIYESLTNYILYLKDNYGVEVEMFSFNESDLGINVRHTAREHADLIKGLGAYMKQKGLKTRMLIGDTADANGWPFLATAMDDPETHPFIGAVSFHSWRGWSDENLVKWKEAADQLGKPLIVGEGSIDAAAWRYPAIFEEPLYAREEINLYVRIMSICQPLSILQWQLTADYSAMSGGGIFGNDSVELHPTQRFWNLKQLGSTPQGLAYIPVSSAKEDVTVAALGDQKGKSFALHLVNNGTTRAIRISGLPSYLRKLQGYITGPESNMEELTVKVKNGRAEFTAASQGFISLFNE